MKHRVPVLNVRKISGGLLLVIPAMYRLWSHLEPMAHGVPYHTTEVGLQLDVSESLELVMPAWQRAAVLESLQAKQQIWMSDHTRRFLTRLLPEGGA